MKKLFSLSILSLFLLISIASLGFSQKAADILEKMVEAKGGREVLESIKDTTVTGLVHPFAFPLMGVPIEDVLSIAAKIYHKEPNKYRIDLERIDLEANGKMFTAQAFDGEAAWIIDSQIGIFKEPPESERENLKKLAYFHGNSYLLYPEKYGITYTYIDKKNIEEEAGIFKNLIDKLGIKDYFVLEQTFPNGNKNYLYVDFKTHLVYIILDQMGPKAEWVMVFYDYKEVDGVMFAYSMSWAFGRTQAQATLTFTDVIFNSGLEDSLFKTKLYSQSEKLKIAMIDIKVISTALADYVTDTGVTPKQDGIYDEFSEFYEALSPFYVKELPVKDPWGNNYLVYCGKSGNGKYGITDCSNDDFIVVSYGRDAEEEIWEFNAMSPEEGIFVVNTADDYNKDIIMWNGSWIRAPRCAAVT